MSRCLTTTLIASATILATSIVLAEPGNGNGHGRPEMFGKRNPFSTGDLPWGRARARLESLPGRARLRAMEWLHRFDFPEKDLESMVIDNQGAVLYVDPVPPEQTIEEDPNRGADGVSPQPAAPATEETFWLHSRPDAPNVVYLDFDGHTLTGTTWSSGTIRARPFDLDGSPATFSDAERRAIAEIWHRVAEDFAAFDIDVTTEEPASFGRDVGRVLITSRTDANGTSMPYGSAGGVAYVNVWGRSDYASYYSPALVYYDNLGKTSTYIAEASAHEFGHNLGLSHDGAGSVAYYTGHGSGATSWAPIMGNSYSRNVTQWSNGEYAGANNIQDDIGIIAGKLDLVADDHGDALNDATPLTVNDSGHILVSNPETDPHDSYPENKGVIEVSGDQDVFWFSAAAGQVDLSVVPAWDAFYRDSKRGANLDIQVRLLNAGGATLAISDPESDTDADISANVAAGIYYLAVSGVGNGNYSDYASAGQYFISGTISSNINEPPTANFGFGCSQLSCNFVDSSNDSDGRIVMLDWDFGDGASGAGENPSHNYAITGNYSVTLTVTDDEGGTDSSTHTVTLDDPETNPDTHTAFKDELNDNTLAPWSQLQSGQITLVDDPTYGKVLRKTSRDDPNGGWAPLGDVLSDFDLVLFARKINTAGGNLVRYSLTGSAGNGYGLYLDYSSGKLTIERRNTWSKTILAASSIGLSGGMQLGHWYTLHFVRQGDVLTAEAYYGRVDPASATPELAINASDSSHTAFSQININGGRDFDTDDITIVAPVTVTEPNTPPTADFNVSCTALSCSFTDISSDNGGSIVMLDWDFGDGANGTGENPSHNYAIAGNYSVTLTVTDNDGGTDSSTHTVTLDDPDTNPGTNTVFKDELNDNTLAPWSQLQSGQITLVDDPTYGKVLRKTSLNDPNGGSAPLGDVLSDFDLVLFARKVNTAGGNLVRYSLTDSAGNGYGLYLDYSSGKLTIERRNTWSRTILAASSVGLSGGMQLGQWYTLHFVRQGNVLTADAYYGRVDPASATPELTINASDSRHTAFSQININGGRDFDTDDIIVGR